VKERLECCSQDTSIVNNIDETIINLKESSVGLNENMEALKHNFLFRGYFKKKAKEEAEKKRLEDEKQNTPVIEGEDEKK
jgi:phospholipid/cholesterol/gamma-HCH transport system substrate-binding protein